MLNPALYERNRRHGYIADFPAPADLHPVVGGEHLQEDDQGAAHVGRIFVREQSRKPEPQLSTRWQERGIGIPHGGNRTSQIGTEVLDPQGDVIEQLIGQFRGFEADLSRKRRPSVIGGRIELDIRKPHERLPGQATHFHRGGVQLSK